MRTGVKKHGMGLDGMGDCMTRADVKSEGCDWWVGIPSDGLEGSRVFL